MNRSRKFLLAGVGVMTPAFALVAERTEARSVEPAAMGRVHDAAMASEADRAALKSTLLALTPVEKLRIGGDSIRLASEKKPKQMSAPKPKQMSAPKRNTMTIKNITTASAA